MLTKTMVSGVDEKNFYIKPIEWYEENNVKVTLNTNVLVLDPDHKELVLSDGTKRNYDILILATGAEAFVPPFPGKDLEGVFSVRHWSDTKKIHDMIEDTTDAVVIGGGVLGLEAAWDLKKGIKNVTVIEKGDALMARQLDADGSKAIKKAADEAGINVAFESGTDEIVGTDGKVIGVKLDTGETIPAQLVIISTGIRQNTELVKDHDVEITRSIVVNDKMETGLPDVYAIGDCAEAGGVNYGIWPQALDMAKTAVANIFGEDKRYKAIVPANLLMVGGFSLYAIGDNGKNEDLKYETHLIGNPDENQYEKYYFADDKLVGGTLVGSIAKLSKLQKAFNDGASKDDFLKEIE